MIVHIQQRLGLPATDGCYVAWRALDDRGWSVRPFASLDELEPHAEEPVIGGVGTVVGALHRLGVEPDEVDYPRALLPFLVDPDVRDRTLGWVRSSADRWPLFVKPRGGSKEFTGAVVRSSADLARLSGLDDQLPVWVARSADLAGRTEWRAFVIDGMVRDIRPYSGCPDGDAPTRTMIQMMANQWSSAPVSFAMDVVDLGVGGNPDWRIVECNDGYSLAPYGLFASTYAELLVKRWFQLTRATASWH